MKAMRSRGLDVDIRARLEERMNREATNGGRKQSNHTQAEQNHAHECIDRPTSVCRLSECLTAYVCVCVLTEQDADGERLGLFSTYLSICTYSCIYIHT